MSVLSISSDAWSARSPVSESVAGTGGGGGWVRDGTASPKCDPIEIGRLIDNSASNGLEAHAVPDAGAGRRDGARRQLEDAFRPAARQADPPGRHRLDAVDDGPLG